MKTLGKHLRDNGIWPPRWGDGSPGWWGPARTGLPVGILVVSAVLSIRDANPFQIVAGVIAAGGVVMAISLWLVVRHRLLAAAGCRLKVRG